MPVSWQSGETSNREASLALPNLHPLTPVALFQSQLLDLPAMLGVPPDHPWVSPNATIGGDAPPAPRSAPPLEVIRGLRCAGEAMQKETVEPAQRLWPATKAVEWSPEGASCVEIACSNLWR